jgi:hypothetical protein
MGATQAKWCEIAQEADAQLCEIAWRVWQWRR